MDESARVAAEIPWPDVLLEGFGGEVDIHEASGHWDRTGAYTVSVVELEQDLLRPEDLDELESEKLRGSPFTSLAEAVVWAARECPVVIVRHGSPVSGIFFSARREEPVGLRLPRLPDGWL